jgi:asparagine synthase (glutamine-hydrolysing)
VSKNKFVTSSLERLRFGRQKKEFNWGFKNIIAAYFPAHVSIALEKREFNKILHHPDISKDMLDCLKGREWEGIHKPIVTKLNDILYFNMMQYGLEELLRFSDRNAMANGCESRLPFLQHELVSFIFYLPTQLKIQKGHTKYILRKMMEKKLPQKIVWRTDKVAFETPQKKWMDSPFLKAYLQDAKKLLVQEGILRPEALQRKSKSKNVHEPDNFDWRYLCVAQMLRKT